MYGHLRALSGMGAGAADIPVGSSMGGGSAAPAAPRPHGWGAGRLAGEQAGKAAPSAIADAVAQNALKTTAKGVANVHGFASKTSGGSSLHKHADSFQRSKGVVNTVGCVVAARGPLSD
jgi:hypothetical protein